MAVLAGGDADGRGFAADAGVAEDVVGAGGLFHPPGVERGLSCAGAVDGFEDAPALVGVDHELVVPADFAADEEAAAEVVGGVATDFEFEVGPAVGEGLLAEAADFGVVEAEPADGGGVGGQAGGAEGGDAVGFGGGLGFEEGKGLGGREGVIDVAEVDGGDDFRGGHLGEEEPERLADGPGVEVPDGVDDGGGGEVDDAFFGAEPAELGVGDEGAGEGGEVGGETFEGAADEGAGEELDCGDAEFGTAAEGEGEAVAFEGGVGFEDAVGGGVVGVGVDGVGADLEAGGREAQVDGADGRDLHFCNSFGYLCGSVTLSGAYATTADLGRGPAAVDVHDGAGDEGGFIRA